LIVQGYQFNLSAVNAALIIYMLQIYFSPDFGLGAQIAGMAGQGQGGAKENGSGIHTGNIMLFRVVGRISPTPGEQAQYKDQDEKIFYGHGQKFSYSDILSFFDTKL
jgi:hypothetical protein